MGHVHIVTSRDVVPFHSSRGIHGISKELKSRPFATEDATYHDWMAREGACHVILRPDFYVAATARTPGELSDRLDQVMMRLGAL